MIDGDTWDVGGDRVRLFGIDAPEVDQTCQRRNGEVWACGQWVSQQVRKDYDGKSASCTALDTDRYGRIVGRCAGGGEDAGRVMGYDGLACAHRR